MQENVVNQASISIQVRVAGRKADSEELGDLSASAGILLGGAISLILWQALLLAVFWALH